MSKNDSYYHKVLEILFAKLNELGSLILFTHLIAPAQYTIGHYGLQRTTIVTNAAQLPTIVCGTYHLNRQAPAMDAETAAAAYLLNYC